MSLALRVDGVLQPFFAGILGPRNVLLSTSSSNKQAHAHTHIPYTLSLFIFCSYVFHYMVERGIIYLCLADEKQKRRVPFLFLEDMRTKFQQSYGERAATAIAFAMNADFARVIQDRMVSFLGLRMTMVR